MKNKIILILFYLLTSTIYSTAQSWDWATSVSGGDFGFSVAGIATDAGKDIYITGLLGSSSITFGSFTLYDPYSGNFSYIYIAKYDSSGSVVWANSFGGTNGSGGTNNTNVFGITNDKSGNIFITGIFNCPTLSFGSFTLTRVGSWDMFLVKFDSSGNVLWANSAGGTASDIGRSVVADTSGNVYVTGSFASDTISFGSITLYNDSLGSNRPDIFVAKYSSSGNILWANSAGGAGYDEGTGISVDAIGNVYVTGYFESDSISFGAILLTNIFYHYSFNPWGNIFITKYDSSGNVLWANSVGSDNEYSASIATDANSNVYVTGYFLSDSVAFGTTMLYHDTTGLYKNIFVAKSDSSGNFLWAKTTGRGISEGIGIVTDSIGYVYLTGNNYSDTITFDNIRLNYSGPFIVKYDDSGNVIYAKGAGGNNYGQSSGIAATVDGNEIYIAGGYADTTLILGSDTLPFSLFTSGYLFIARLGCPLAPPVINLSGSILQSTSASTYQWFLNGVSITGATSQTYTPVQNGNYVVTVTNSGGCSATSDAFNLTNVGIHTLENRHTVSVYPNPFNNELNIDLSNSSGSLFSANIRDVTGKILLQVTGNETEINKALNDLAGKLAQGIYMLRIETVDAKTINQRIVKI